LWERLTKTETRISCSPAAAPLSTSADLSRSEMLVEGQNGSGYYFYLPHGTAATLSAELL
jgi:hypothetical protein